MLEIHTNLNIGNISDCFMQDKEGWAVIHACKSPCHQRALGYKGSLNPTHPYYLVYERGNHLFLNMIDPPQPLFKLPLFSRSLDFIDKHISDHKVIIHCNHGLSRAPSIALLYLSKRLKRLNLDNFRKATEDFLDIFPQYRPGRGIVRYLSSNWDVIT